jgi:cytochrome c oxidase cbb3-type subunit 3
MIRSKRNLLITAGLLMSTASWGQGAASASFLDNNFQEIVLFLLITVLVVFLLSSIVIFQRFLGLMIDQLPEEKQAKYRREKGLVNWEWINRRLTDAVPIEREKDIMLDHEYDGIRELDNHLPPWWKWLFYATIIYAVAYMAHHYVFQTGKDQYEIYEIKIAEAEEAKKAFLSTLADNVDETNITLVTDAAKLAEGQQIYTTKCAACHGMLGQGAVGPNLTDPYWIHGGSLVDVFTVVKYGVANKMIAWEDQLLPGEMANVSSYVMTLQGSEPEGARDPQGDYYEPAPLEEASQEAQDEGEGTEGEDAGGEGTEASDEAEVTAALAQ